MDRAAGDIGPFPHCGWVADGVSLGSGLAVAAAGVGIELGEPKDGAATVSMTTGAAETVTTAAAGLGAAVVVLAVGPSVGAHATSARSTIRWNSLWSFMCSPRSGCGA